MMHRTERGGGAGGEPRPCEHTVEAGKAVRLSLYVAFAFLAAMFGVAATGLPLPWEVLQPDTSSYVTLASNLSEKGIFSLDGMQPTACRELLYPLFLALFMKVGLVKPYVCTVSNMLPVLAVQALLYLWSLSLLSGLAFRWNMDKAAPLVVLWGCFYLPISQYSFQVVSELPALVLVTICFTGAQRAADKDGIMPWLLAGLGFGLFALLKSVMLPFGALVAGCAVLWRRASLAAGLLFFCASLLLPLSWGVRNYVHFERFIPGTTDGASSLYRGNMLLGEQVPNMGDPRIPEAVVEEVRRAEPARRDAVLMERVWERFANHPWECCAQFAYKGFVLLFGLPLTPLHVLFMAARGMLLGLVGSRTVHMWRQGHFSIRLVLIYAGFLFCIYTLFYATPRYFIPAFFMLLPFAVEAALHWGEKMKKGASA